MKDFHHQHGEDLHDEQQMINDHQDGEIWLDREQDDLLDVNDASIFYGDFPPLPDFPCMSSSSSSSSTQAPLKSVAGSTSSSSASSSSSAASWAVLKSDAEEDVDKRNNNSNYHHDHNSGGYPQEYQHQVEHQEFVEANTGALSSTASMEIPQPSDQGIDGVDCMDVMETFGYMDLLESNDFFDPSSMFQADDNLLEEFQQEQKTEMEQDPPPNGNDQELMTEDKNPEIQQSGGVGDDRGGAMASDDLAMVFLEWLKSNKETVSAEDLRSVKIKKATIECAVRRLGGGKEGMKQLLKLILEWVQTNHLQRRSLRESSSSINIPYQDPIQNPNPTNPTSTPNPCNPNSLQPDQTVPCFAQSPWIPPPPPYDPAPVVPAFQPVLGYMGDPFVNAPPSVNNHQYPPPPDYHMLDSSQSWPSSQFSLASHYPSFGDNNMQQAPTHPNAYAGYGNQYQYQYLPGHSGDRLARLGSSATKEARKKRMARQRRFMSHHRNHSSHQQQHNNSHQNHNHGLEQHARIGNDNVAPVAAQANPPNWVYWPPPAAAPIPASTAPVMPVEPPPMVNPAERPAMQNQNFQRQVGTSDRRQGWKPEKNLRFLLQKVLKQSDVGNLGRIVLPKKEAETHLPELEARDGISIAMEDIGTSRVWNMRYRFWPNNKSRMYLLENTGDFVRTNGLQEGDFIVIYSDVKCGKYLIRGVKVRQPGPKSENKRAGKSQRSVQANSPAPIDGIPSSTPNNQTQNHNTKKSCLTPTNLPVNQ